MGAAEDLLGYGARVDVCGGEGRDALVERRGHARGSRLLLDLRAMRKPVAVGDLTDLQPAAAETTIFHQNPSEGPAAFRRRETAPTCRAVAETTAGTVRHGTTRAGPGPGRAVRAWAARGFTRLSRLAADPGGRQKIGRGASPAA